MPFARPQRGAVTLIGALFIVLVVSLMVQIINRMASSDITDTAAHNDAVDALFVAESGIEFASFNYANGTACADLALINTTPAGRGSFDVTAAGLVGTDCRIVVQGSVSSTGAASPDAALRTVSADLRLAGDGGWAVGDNGAMLQWNGASWSAVASNTAENLYSVHCTAASDCWATGNNGAIIHWDGTSWSPLTSGTNAVLLGVSCQPFTATHCYANGVTLLFGLFPIPYSARWNGSNWINAGGSGFFDSYTDVSCPSATCFSVLAGGSVQASSPSWGTVFNGTIALNGIDCAAADQCWAVGDLSGNRYYVVRNNGGAWSGQTVAAPVQRRTNLNAVSCSSVNDCWAVGDNLNSRYVFVHWDGLSWTSDDLQSGQHREKLNGVHCSSAVDCWAVGNQRNGWNLVHYDGTSWSYVGSAAPGPQNLNDVYLSGAGSAGVSLVRWQELINN